MSSSVNAYTRLAIECGASAAPPARCGGDHRNHPPQSPAKRQAMITVQGARWKTRPLPHTPLVAPHRRRGARLAGTAANARASECPQQHRSMSKQRMGGQRRSTRGLGVCYVGVLGGGGVGAKTGGAGLACACGGAPRGAQGSAFTATYQLHLQPLAAAWRWPSACWARRCKSAQATLSTCGGGLGSQNRGTAAALCLAQAGPPPRGSRAPDMSPGGAARAGAAHGSQVRYRKGVRYACSAVPAFQGTASRCCALAATVWGRRGVGAAPPAGPPGRTKLGQGGGRAPSPHW